MPHIKAVYYCITKGTYSHLKCSAIPDQCAYIESYHVIFNRNSILWRSEQPVVVPGPLQKHIVCLGFINRISVHKRQVLIDFTDDNHFTALFLAPLQQLNSSNTYVSIAA